VQNFDNSKFIINLYNDSTIKYTLKKVIAKKFKSKTNFYYF